MAKMIATKPVKKHEKKIKVQGSKVTTIRFCFRLPYFEKLQCFFYKAVVNFHYFSSFSFLDCLQKSVNLATDTHRR